MSDFDLPNKCENCSGLINGCGIYYQSFAETKIATADTYRRICNKVGAISLDDCLDRNSIAQKELDCFAIMFLYGMGCQLTEDEIKTNIIICQYQSNNKL